MKFEEEIDEYFRLKITERGWPAHYICAESSGRYTIAPKIANFGQTKCTTRWSRN